MAYFSAGAWWSSNGQAFATQQEAVAFEQSGQAPGSDTDSFAAAMGRGNTGVKAPLPRATNASGLNYADTGEATPVAQQRYNVLHGNGIGANSQVVANQTGIDQLFSPSKNVNAAHGYGPDADPKDYKFDPVKQQYYTQVPIGYGGSPDGRLYINNDPRAIARQLDTPQFSLQEHANGPPVPGARSVQYQVIAGDPTGADPRQRLATPAEATVAQANYDASHALNPSGGRSSPTNRGQPGGTDYFNPLTNPGLANVGGAAPGVGAQYGASSVQQGLTPQQIMGMNTPSARPSSAQQDSIVNQMMGQSQVQSGYQDFNSPQYNQSRNAAMGYTSGLAGLASNNIGTQGLDGGQYNQSRGTAQQAYGDLRNQATNNVGDIQANQGQRLQSRAMVTGTANELTNNANRDVDRIDASQAQRGASAGSIVDVQNRLMSGMNNVNDIQADASNYNAMRARQDNTLQQVSGLAGQPLDEGRNNAIINNLMEKGNNPDVQTEQLVQDLRRQGNAPMEKDVNSQAAFDRLMSLSNSRDPNSQAAYDRLMALSNAQEGPSAAESLMLNAQERATRNAIGNGASMGGGWRSQLTNQRQAMGQAASQQADIAAQIGALRANEAATFRGQAIDATGQAGQLGLGMSGQQLDAASNAGTLGLGMNQQGIDYRGQSIGALQGAGTLQGGMMDRQLNAMLGAGQLSGAATDRDITNRGQNMNALLGVGGLQGDMAGRDSQLAQSNAALLAQIRQGNQLNTRESQIASGQLGLGRLNSDTAVAMSDADRAMLAAQGNQQNRLNSLLGAGGLQSGIMTSDTNLAQSDAALLAQIRQGNQANSLNSLLGASNSASQTLNSDLGFASADADVRARREIANQQNSLQAMLGAANAANQTAGLDANIGTSNADRRSQVDQNNRANSIAALQNAGVLSSNTRAQDVQLSVADAQALTSRISSAAGLSGTIYAAQLDAAMKQQDINLRQKQFDDALARMPPPVVEQFLRTAGPAFQILGMV